MAVWPSWPQACILPWCLLACAKVLSSVTGSASMSARRPTARGLVPFFTMPTTPVVPRPRWIGMPHSVSLAATTSAVRTSWKQSSGWGVQVASDRGDAGSLGDERIDEFHGAQF